MDFRAALNLIHAELTPRPWDYTADNGMTLTVTPAGLRADPGQAEVTIRLTRPDATGLYDHGLTGPDSRGVAEVGVTTTSLPALIQALTERTRWADTDLVAGSLLADAGADGVAVEVTEVHGPGQQVTVSTLLPEAQRLPLASALQRALDVARDWEDAPNP